MRAINALDKIIFFLLLISLLVIASRAECEVLNLDTNECERYLDQNLSLNNNWIEFY